MTRGEHKQPVKAGIRLGVCALCGAVVGTAVGLFASWQLALLMGWMTAAAVFVVWVGLTILRMDSAATREHAGREDNSQAASDLVLLVAAVASLGAVYLLLAGPTGGSSGSKALQGMLTLASVLLSWGTIHMLYTTRYALMYYADEPGGIDFKSKAPPRYTDFAYVSFTVGMTFQVSDTDLQLSEMRATVLRHALLSYLFGAGIIAATVNLLAGLSK